MSSDIDEISTHAEAVYGQ